MNAFDSGIRLVVYQPLLKLVETPGLLRLVRQVMRIKSKGFFACTIQIWIYLAKLEILSSV